MAHTSPFQITIRGIYNSLDLYQMQITLDFVPELPDKYFSNLSLSSL